METQKRIIAEIPANLAVWLKVEAAKQGRSMREILIELIEQKMTNTGPKAVKANA